jgi:hypothetical protein
MNLELEPGWKLYSWQGQESEADFGAVGPLVHS